MSDKISEKKEKAVKAVRDYLVELLEAEKWCDANKVGETLKNLVLPTIPWLAQTAGAAEMYTQQMRGIAGLGGSR